VAAVAFLVAFRLGDRLLRAFGVSADPACNARLVRPTISPQTQRHFLFSALIVPRRSIVVRIGPGHERGCAIDSLGINSLGK